MISDLLLALLKLNLAASAAIVLVLALRPAILKLFGAQATYALWLAPPLAGAACLLPALRSVPETAQGTPNIAAMIEGAPIVSLILTVVWLAGAAVVLTGLIAGQRRFMRRAAAGEAGPAIIGILDPRLILPRDFTERYTEDEQVLIRAHERVHVERDDPRANALLAALQCLFWYNPLVHLAANRIRLDQELSCDAAVIARHPGARRRYAQAMLKTQLGGLSAPVGCHWLAPQRHPLEARIALLKTPTPTSRRQILGFGLITAIAVATALTAWTAQPPRTRQPPAPGFPAPVMNIILMR
jgi:beta-lactamase regulating signal transducer with metallopeptidase domain